MDCPRSTAACAVLMQRLEQPPLMKMVLMLTELLVEVECKCTSQQRPDSDGLPGSHQVVHGRQGDPLPQPHHRARCEDCRQRQPRRPHLLPILAGVKSSEAGAGFGAMEFVPTTRILEFVPTTRTTRWAVW